MTQVKLWQIVSQTPNAIVFTDAEGNLKTLNAGGEGQILVAGLDGSPMWVDNTALTAALQAQSAATSAIDVAKAYTEAQIAALVDNAPVALNTLNELAQKLSGEDSAINALLLQVDGKAEKTEMDTAIALAKQEAIQSAMQHIDYNVGNAMDAATNQIAQASADIIATAQMDAQAKADAALASAITQAGKHTDLSIGSLRQELGADVDAKTIQARTIAVTEANNYTDNAIANAAIASNAATDGRITASQEEAAADASAKVDALRQAIPGTFWVEGTATACFVASSTNFNLQQVLNNGVLLSNGFAEVTGATVNVSDQSLKIKLLFINGVAMSSEWAPTRVGNELAIVFTEKLAKHIFDGSENAIMVLAEYRSYDAISMRS